MQNCPKVPIYVLCMGVYGRLNRELLLSRVAYIEKAFYFTKLRAHSVATFYRTNLKQTISKIFFSLTISAHSCINRIAQAALTVPSRRNVVVHLGIVEMCVCVCDLCSFIAYGRQE